MYSVFRLAQKFFNYFITASNGKGHGIHSPFVFNFVTRILRDKKKYPAFIKIEKRRNELLQDGRTLTIQDFGAGSVTRLQNVRAVKKIASTSLKPAKYAQLFYKMGLVYQPKTIVELGTSFGITASYLASANNASLVYTLEGAPEIAAIASETFSNLSLKNINLTIGNFDDNLPVVLEKLQTVDLAFVDGNHRKAPTLAYFSQLLQKHTENSVFIFDDIHWSKEMEEAWEEIKNHPAVTLSIDLFFIGMVFFRKENKVKQHFRIRY